MLGRNRNHLAVIAGLALAAGAVTAGVAPVPALGCSAAAVGTSTNDNAGHEFERNDATAHATAEAECDIANDVLRNVEDVLNENNNRNLVGNLSHNNNDSGNHNLNNNIRDLFNGSAVTL
jgi:hypothetical protein